MKSRGRRTQGEELPGEGNKSKLADEKFPNQAADHSGNAKADQCSVKGAVHNQCRFHTLKGSGEEVGTRWVQHPRQIRASSNENKGEKASAFISRAALVAAFFCCRSEPGRNAISSNRSRKSYAKVGGKRVVLAVYHGKCAAKSRVVLPKRRGLICKKSAQSESVLRIEEADLPPCK